MAPARISPEGGYVAGVLPGFVISALGLGLAVPASTIAATSGVDGAEQGLASGVLIATRQVGPALGLAVMVTLATAHAAVLSGARPSPEALAGGHRWAFVAGTGIAPAGTLTAHFVVPRSLERRRASGTGPAQDP